MQIFKLCSGKAEFAQFHASTDWTITSCFVITHPILFIQSDPSFLPQVYLGHIFYSFSGIFSLRNSTVKFVPRENFHEGKVKKNSIFLLVQATTEIKIKLLANLQQSLKICTQGRFLVACYATLQPALSVHLSVGPSVTLYFFQLFAVFGLTAPAQMIK